MNQEYVKRLAEFCEEPAAGQFLVFCEYLDGHGGGIYLVVDVVTFGGCGDGEFDGVEVDENDARCHNVPGWCDSTGYDGIVTLECWDNGEAYLSGDGVNHPRYRVVGIMAIDLGMEDDDQLTDMAGCPMYWGIWMQDSWDDQPGTKVEFAVKAYVNDAWRWFSRKAFGNSPEEVQKLVDEAREELARPKYHGHARKVTVAGAVVWEMKI
jgi:hypothetical protein